MIKLKNGGVVREVQTQREADYYAKFGYKTVNNSDGSKKPLSSGKKGTPKEE